MGKPKRKLTKYNKCMSRELKGKLSGKTKAQRAAIFKAAAKRCSGKTPKRASRPKPKSRARVTRAAPGGTRTMAKNSFNMSKIYSLANKVAFIAPFAAVAMSDAPNELKINRGIAYLTGYSMSEGTWSFENLKRGWLPYVMTKITTSVVPKITSFIKGMV